MSHGCGAAACGWQAEKRKRILQEERLARYSDGGSSGPAGLHGGSAASDAGDGSASVASGVSGASASSGVATATLISSNGERLQMGWVSSSRTHRRPTRVPGSAIGLLFDAPYWALYWAPYWAPPRARRGDATPRGVMSWAVGDAPPSSPAVSQVTLKKAGKLTVSHDWRLGPSERYDYQTQWQRRQANDKWKFSVQSEVSCDPTKIGFAFGGVFPGWLHSKGNLADVHKVSRRAGRLPSRVPPPRSPLDGLRSRDCLAWLPRLCLLGLAPTRPSAVAPVIGAVMGALARAPVRSRRLAWRWWVRSDRPRRLALHGSARARVRRWATPWGAWASTQHASAHHGALPCLQVSYSVGRVGKYLLHVRLRKQAAELPGSPFALTVKPGPAHSAATKLPTDLAAPIRGHVGTSADDGCRLTFWTHDQIGNACTEGGAKVENVCRVAGKAMTAHSPVDSTVEDNGDGSYVLAWKGVSSGLFHANITIDKEPVGGSPILIRLNSTIPELGRTVLEGAGLHSGIAGEPSTVMISFIDSHGNPCRPADKFKIGIAVMAELKKKVRRPRLRPLAAPDDILSVPGAAADRR